METAPARRAMIFAAGLGTRLKPLTDTLPKALVPICGKPLLQHVVGKLAAAGYADIVVNVHHFADQVIRWVDEHPSDGVRIRISDERESLLDTGGGLLNAAPLLLSPAPTPPQEDLLKPSTSSTPPTAKGRGPLPLMRPRVATVFRRSPCSGSVAGDSSLCAEPILVHNVDILSDIDLEAFRRQWRTDALAVIAVSERKTQRYFLFDAPGRLAGWTNLSTGEVRSPFGDIDPADYRLLAFSGIHLVSPGIFAAMREEGFDGRFSITDFYLKVCDRYPIYAFPTPGATILDVGKINTLPEVETAAEKLHL